MLLHTDDTDAVLDVHFSAIESREALQPREHALADELVSQQGSPSLPARPSMSEINGMEPRFTEALIFKMAHGNKVLPIERVRRMTLFSVIRAGVPPIGGRCLSVKVEALIRIGGKGFHCLVLENKIANAVKNRLALVNLNSKRDMRAVPDEQIGARSDRLAGKSRDEIGRLFAFSDVACFAQALATELVPMKTHHHPIGLPAGFANPPEILFEILVVH